MVTNPTGDLASDEKEESPRPPVSDAPSITSSSADISSIPPTGFDISNINIYCINPACNGINCVDCATFTVHPPYLTETPDARNQELWIRRVVSTALTRVGF